MGFGDWANERDHGDVCRQAKRAAVDIGGVPASVVGEWSVAFKRRKGNECRDEQRLNAFLAVQEEEYALNSTHGDFFWTWSDRAFGWSRKEAFLQPPARPETPPEAANDAADSRCHAL